MSRFALPLTACLAAIAVAGCSGTPTVQTGPDAETIDGKLYRVDNTAAQLVYVDPTVDFSRYNRILLAPLGVDSVEIIQPDNSSMPYARRRDWELTDEDRAALQAGYREVMLQELVDKGGYALAEAPGDDVLLITAMLTQLAPNAPKDDNQSRYAGRSQVYTEGAGSIAVAVAFADSETGEVLALSKDRRRSTQQWGVNNRVTNRAEVRRVFSAWARQIRQGLDQVHGRDAEAE
ncbi:DUF3313 family protein [Pseudohaliea sp.]|uniref:DUF3313 family protein n=1 Tax=Pseudohaliea sp. TaxID=2740289 RepID=UPI0032EDF71B